MVVLGEGALFNEQGTPIPDGLDEEELEVLGERVVAEQRNAPAKIMKRIENILP